MIYVPISIGELIDKITILKIKLERITDVEKLENIKKEYTILINIMKEIKIDENDEMFQKLYKLNIEFWDYHEWQRQKWKETTDNKIDVELYYRTRTEHELNDKRAIIKKEINIKYKSEIIEEKAYNFLTPK